MFLLVNTKKPAKMVTTFDTWPVTDVVTGELICAAHHSETMKLASCLASNFTRELALVHQIWDILMKNASMPDSKNTI